jgi:ribose/xylose/arabinose/galactoside ABC-type transport system permease subunit
VVTEKENIDKTEFSAINFGKVSLWKKVANSQESGIFIALMILALIIGLINPVFFKFANMMHILKTASYFFIPGIAITYVLVAAGLDLSIGSVLALGGVGSGLALLAGIPIIFSILVGVAVGMLAGFLNGFIITKFSIPPLITTLGMMYLARGFVEVLTKGTPVYPLPASFNIIGQGSIGGVPYVVIIAIILGIIGHIILTQTRFGRSVFAIGGNEETARLSGININKIKLIVYMLAGGASALSGVIISARVAAAQANAGVGYELRIISACIIGGTSMFGGKGSVLGSFIGAVFMAVVANGMILTKISVFYQNIIFGIIIILAVGLDQWKRLRSEN